MTIRGLALTLLLTVGFVLGCGDESSEPGEDGASNIDFARFDQALQKAIDDHNATSDQKIAGASAAVVHEKLGVLHTQGYGELAADRLYLIASSSDVTACSSRSSCRATWAYSSARR